MQCEAVEDTLRVWEVEDLHSANSQAFKEQVRSEFGETLKNVEIDLSKTKFIDSSGLGALVALYKDAGARGGRVRLLRPTPFVKQTLELTRMHRIFEITTE